MRREDWFDIWIHIGYTERKRETPDGLFGERWSQMLVGDVAKELRDLPTVKFQFRTVRERGFTRQEHRSLFAIAEQWKGSDRIKTRYTAVGIEPMTPGLPAQNRLLL